MPPPAIYACTHDVGKCHCRKPEAGLLEMAASNDPSIEPANAAVVGDSLSDLEAGAEFGARTKHLIASGSRRVDLEREAALRGIHIDSIHASLAELVSDQFGLA